MGIRNGIGTLALVLVSGGAGWLLHGWTLPPPPEAPAVPAGPDTPAAQTTGSLLAFPQVAGAEGGGDQVELHPDGSASVRVQHRPPAWVLAELCRQGARGLPGCGTAQPAAANQRAAHPPPEESEHMQLRALAQARLQGQPLPDATLQSMMQSSPSEEVRMEAFEDYVEAHAGSDEELRMALQQVLRMPSPALQARARAQLEDLEATARHNAAAVQQQEQQAGPY